MASVSRRSFLICRNFSPGIPVTDPANKSSFFHRRPAPTREKLPACARISSVKFRMGRPCSPSPSPFPALPNFSTILARNGRPALRRVLSLSLFSFYPSRGNIATFARFFIVQRIRSAAQVFLLLSIEGNNIISRLILTVDSNKIWNVQIRFVYLNDLFKFNLIKLFQ